MDITEIIEQLDLNVEVTRTYGPSRTPWGSSTKECEAVLHTADKALVITYYGETPDGEIIVVGAWERDGGIWDCMDVQAGPWNNSGFREFVEGLYEWVSA